MQDYIVGVDEAGRGPLAGPVSVAAIAVKKNSPILKLIRGIRDSKQLSEKQREEWFVKIKNWEKRKLLKKAVSMVGSQTIDRRGIVRSVHLALTRSINKLSVSPNRTQVLLDGSLYAPKEYKNQKTIIGGDEKVSLIALASIVAKVSRDRRMKRLSKKYPRYGFDVHKGYGSALHIKLIRRYGLSDIHRRSFCRSFYRPLTKKR
ncbi:MAG: ribonuclease HII [Patescibacteria group bacterium]